MAVCQRLIDLRNRCFWWVIERHSDDTSFVFSLDFSYMVFLAKKKKKSSTHCGYFSTIYKSLGPVYSFSRYGKLVYNWTSQPQFTLPRLLRKDLTVRKMTDKSQQWSQELHFLTSHKMVSHSNNAGVKNT